MCGRLSAAVIAIALLAGCGGGASSGRSNPSRFRAQFVAFASCMRAHGEPGYPDPRFSNGADGLQVRISPGAANPNTPAFASADHACHHLITSGGAPSASGGHARGVAFAACMRTHGVPDFPDPDHDGAFTLPPGVDQQAPAFKRALQGCGTVKPKSLLLNQSG
jgi:hypothetical protein